MSTRAAKDWLGLGLRIKDLRQKIGINSSELARRVGVSPAATGKWEAGTSRPQGENLQKLANVLATTPEYLEGETEDPLPRWDGADQSRANWVAARYGIDPSIALRIIGDLETPPPDQVYEAMEEVREARRALRRAANRLEALFGPIDHPDAPDEFEDEIRRPASILPLSPAEPTWEEMFGGGPSVADVTINKSLERYGLRRSDFRPNYSDLTIWQAIGQCEKDPAFVEVLRSMTMPLEHKPGVSRGKAARHDLKNK